MKMRLRASKDLDLYRHRVALRLGIEKCGRLYEGALVDTGEVFPTFVNGRDELMLTVVVNDRVRYIRICDLDKELENLCDLWRYAQDRVNNVAAEEAKSKVLEALRKYLRGNLSAVA